MNPPLSICAANQERLRLTCNRKKLQIPICAKNRLTVTALNLVLVRPQEAHPQSSHVDSERFGLLGGNSGWSIQGMIVECSVPCAGDSISGRLTTMFGTQPCARLRLQSILTHERSVAHKDAIQLAAAAAATENVVSALNRPVSARAFTVCIFWPKM